MIRISFQVDIRPSRKHLMKIPYSYLKFTISAQIYEETNNNLQILNKTGTQHAEIHSNLGPSLFSLRLTENENRILF